MAPQPPPSTSVHPIARAISRLADSFARDAPRLAMAADGHLGLGGGLGDGLIPDLVGGMGALRGGITLEGCAAACAHAQRAVRRVGLEALMMYPQLAPRSSLLRQFC